VEAKQVVSIRDRLIGFVLKHINTFEPFAKFGISYVLNRQLKQYRQQGILSAYKTKVRRLGKWHYRIEVDLDATAVELAGLSNLVVQQFGDFGR
jgi:hypothetical protein